MRKLGVNKFANEDILGSGERVHEAVAVDDWYLVDGLEDNQTVQRVRFNKTTGIGTAEIEEVTYTTDPDIDQEVCQGYSDERGDYEYTRTFVTDLNEERHVDNYEINIHVAA